ncbi:MAG TPA: glycosyltransferase [Terriglobales bacterium]|nr:glycosyltransferase [Terriglobales bacterium]
MSGIPKRIIQTGKQLRQPLRNRAAMRSLALLNPDYEYIFFDNAGVERFIDENFPQYRQIFAGFPFRIQRYDFFRYLAIYKLGGFYFDLDVLLAEDLAGLLGHDCVFPFEGLTFSRFLRSRYGMDWQIGNYAFGATAGHAFLKAAIENCVKAQQDPSWVAPMMRGFPPLFRDEFLILNTTGPGLISRTLAENPELAKSVTVLFPTGNVCELENWNLFGDLGVHLLDGSWRSRGNFVHRRLAQAWELWKMRRLMKESLELGTARRHLHPQGASIMGR